MPYIHATDRPLLWAVTQSNAILASGLTEVGGLTITGEDKALVSDADENAFLGAVAGRGGDYNPLPDAGEWVEAGAIGFQKVDSHKQKAPRHTPGRCASLSARNEAQHLNGLLKPVK